MSKQIKIVKGRHMWCPEGSRVVKTTWNEGENGGPTDTTVTEAVFAEKQEDETLVLYAKNERIRNGSCFESEERQRQPRDAEELPDGKWKYTWRYCNSTE